ncbi:MAG: hypothetical protein V1724_09790, partial [Chloroflexota bacterium]
PAEQVDELIYLGKVDRGIPFIKKKAMGAFQGSEMDLPTTLSKIDGIRAYYQENYPEIFAQKKDKIEAAISELTRVAKASIFPDMKTNWKTHINNIGHLESPGCFRCHGKLTTPGPQKQTIDATCEECHYSVQVAPQGGRSR